MLSIILYREGGKFTHTHTAEREGIIYTHTRSIILYREGGIIYTHAE